VSTLPPTAELGLVLPDPGTAQPHSTAVQNGWFTSIDSRFASDRGRIEAAERMTKYGVASGTLGVSPAGTTSQRDTLYPAPTAGAPGAALAVQYANAGLRWFNIDKGYEQQYFAAFDDSGVGATTPAARTRGWGPASANGRVLLPNFTIGKDGGVGTVTKKGARAEFAAVATITLDAIFSNYPEFEEFEVDYVASAASVDLSMVFGFRTAGANDVSANYTHAYRESAPGVGAEGTGTAAASAVLNRVATTGGVMTMRIFNPMSTTASKFWTFQSYDRTGYHRIGGGFLNVPATGKDGFRIYSGGAGSTQTGGLYVYGIPKP